MMSAKAFAAISVSPNLITSNKLFVTGGQINSSSWQNTIEVLTPTGWETLPQSLPVNIYLQCSVLVNSSTVMIIGGSQYYAVCLTNTYYFNIDKHVLTSGPSLSTGRCQHTCGRIRKGALSLELSIIAAGGYGLSSVEILDEASNNWKAGPQLPLGIYASQMIEDPNGGVILVGGISDLTINEDSLYQLQHGGVGAVWTKMDQKLKIGRFWHVAFLVPDYMVDCS